MQRLGRRAMAWVWRCFRIGCGCWGERGRCITGISSTTSGRLGTACNGVRNWLRLRGSRGGAMQYLRSRADCGWSAAWLRSARFAITTTFGRAPMAFTGDARWPTRRGQRGTFGRLRFTTTVRTCSAALRTERSTTKTFFLPATGSTGVRRRFGNHGSRSAKTTRPFPIRTSSS